MRDYSRYVGIYILNLLSTYIKTKFSFFNIIISRFFITKFYNFYLVYFIILKNIFLFLCAQRYGRKYIFITGTVLSAIFGTIKSFAANYYSFLVFEFLDSMASSGVYAATFVLGKKSNPQYIL